MSSFSSSLETFNTTVRRGNLQEIKAAMEGLTPYYRRPIVHAGALTAFRESKDAGVMSLLADAAGLRFRVLSNRWQLSAC